jgi:hypothetical protein
MFLMNEKLSFQELYDMWICRLMFFCRFFLALNDLNTRLQGFGKTIDVMFDNIEIFKLIFEIKLKIFKCDVNMALLNISQTYKNT